jgi:hypothetical protein
MELSADARAKRSVWLGGLTMVMSLEHCADDVRFETKP